MTVTVRSALPGDLEALLTLNTAAVPAVNLVDAGELASLAVLAADVIVAEADGETVGFALTMRPGLDYASENYRWFEARGTDFLYVDRIVVAEARRGEGIGRVLYEAVFARAAELGAVEVCCEVNLDPPNPRSSRFHRALGFRSVGSQPTKGGEVTVELLAADTESPDTP